MKAGDSLNYFFYLEHNSEKCLIMFHLEGQPLNICRLRYFQFCLIIKIKYKYLEYICVLDLNWCSRNFSVSLPYSLSFTTSALK